MRVAGFAILGLGAHVGALGIVFGAVAEQFAISSCSATLNPRDRAKYH